MVFLDVPQFKKAYEVIRDDASGDGCSVLILRATDVDALCTCATITKALKVDSILYTIRSVSGHDDIVSLDGLIQSMEDLKTLILINCASVVNVREMIPCLSDRPEILCYILDANRPVHLSNVRDERQIFLLHMPCPEDEQHSIPPPPSKRHKSSPYESDSSEDESLPLHRVPKEVLYYAESWMSTASAMVSYHLFTALHRPEAQTRSALWYAIVGLTEQFVQERISYDRYVVDVTSLTNDVVRLHAQSDEASDTPLHGMGELTERILVQDDLRFMLYRHWNLYDSIYHSTYVSARMQCWTEPGMQKLRAMFVHLGVSLQEVQQPYGVMSPSQKKLFHAYFAKQGSGKRFQIPDVQFPSFVRKMGNYPPMAASDVVYAVSAIKDGFVDSDHDPDVWREHVVRAYDVLRKHDYDAFCKGVQAAIEAQKSVVELCASIVSRQIIVRCASFRWAVLEEEIPLHASFLLRAARFLAQIHTGRRKRQVMPMLLAAKRPHQASYVLVGSTPMDGQGQETACFNRFSLLFKLAAERTGVQLSHHGFDGSIVDVPAKEVQRFLDYLRET